MNAKCVLIADVIQSRDVADFANRRDRALQLFSETTARETEIQDLPEDSSSYIQTAITAWDECQVLLHQPERIAAVCWQLTRAFAPMQLKIGIGIGAVKADMNARRAINEAASGQAFESARLALQTIENAGKQSSSTAMHLIWSSDDQSRDIQGKLGADSFSLTRNSIAHACNAALYPLSVFANDISDHQWQVINAWYGNRGSQTATAESLDVSVSTISRALQRANFWVIRDIVNHLEQFLQPIFAHK